MEDRGDKRGLTCAKMTSGGASSNDSAFFNLVERTFFEFYKYRGVNAYHTSHNFALKPQILEILRSLGPL